MREYLFRSSEAQVVAANADDSPAVCHRSVMSQTPAEQVQMTGAKAIVMVALVTAQGEVART